MKIRSKIRCIITLMVIINIFLLTTSSYSANDGYIQTSNYEIKSNASIDVDFDKRVDPPLIKKFAMYNAGCINPYSNYDRDLDKINELNAESLRIDLSIGKTGLSFGKTVDGTLDNITYDFTLLDDLAIKLNERNVLPYWSWCYIPVPLQGNDPSISSRFLDLNDNIGNWRVIWQQIHREYARHFKNAGIRIGYHELYNEPDLPGFLSTKDFVNKYFDMYRHGAYGILEGDSDAVVGGPAYAIANNSLAFINHVAANDLPIDFFSFHTYMHGNWQGGMNNVINWLNNHPKYRTVDIHINEISWLNNSTSIKSPLDDGASSPFNFYEAASRTFDAMVEIIERPSVTRVHWAQFMESTFFHDPYGLIKKNGRKKAAFHAFKIYADMPVERVQSISSNSDAIGTLASGDGKKQSLVIWNKSNLEQMTDINLVNLPFNSGTLRVYRIDKEHASFFDGAPEELEVVEEYKINSNSHNKQITIPRRGVVYIVIDNDSGVPQFSPNSYDNFVADDIRVTTYHIDRSTNQTNYAAFDRKTWKAYQGMGKNDIASPFISVTAENIPDVLKVKYDIGGMPKQINKNSILGLRIDYMVGSNYTHSVLYHGGIYDSSRDSLLPWGAKTANPTEAVQVDLQDFTVNVAEKAPNNWNGRVVVSFMMQNLGEDTRAEISIYDPNAIEEAVSAYEAAPITTFEEIVEAEALEKIAKTKLALLEDGEGKQAFLSRIDVKKADVEIAEQALLELQKQAEAEEAVTAYETAPISTTEEIEAAELLEEEANAKVALLQDEEVRIAFEARIAIKRLEVDTAKTIPLYGDINGDNNVTNVDLILLKRYVAGITVNNIDLVAADVNGDGNITNVDIILLSRYLAGIINRLGPQ